MTAKITYILPNLEAGGTERALLHLVRRLDRSRFSPRLVTTAGGGILFPDFASTLSVTVDGDPTKSRSFRATPVDHAKTVVSLVRGFRRNRPDIVHAFLPAANLLGSVAARFAVVPHVVVSKRALCDYKASHQLLAKVEPLGNLLADAILVNSDAVRRDVERTERPDPRKFVTVHNGVEPVEPWDATQIAAFREREGVPRDAVVAISVANFYGYKRHLDLVEAATHILPTFPKMLFLLVGRDAGTMAATRERIDALGLSASFLIAGPKRDVADLLRASDLFVHPSGEEGFSNAILEAMAAGLPVVAYAVGGNTEAIVDGETGLLASPRDVLALGDAMGTLLANPEKRATMGEAGRRRARTVFSMETMVSATEALYDRLLGRKE